MSLWVEVLIDVHVPELGRSFEAGEVAGLDDRIARLMVADGYAVFIRRPQPVRETEEEEAWP